MADLKPPTAEQLARLDRLSHSIKEYFLAIGSPADICRELGIENGEGLVLRAYAGELLPSWAFIQHLMLLADRKASGPHLTRTMVRRRHRDALIAFRLSDGTMDALYPSEAEPRLYNFFDPSTGIIQAVPVPPRERRGRASRPVASSAPDSADRPVPAKTMPVKPVSARVWADAPGYDLRPDPMTVHDMNELLQRLREYWQWADRPSMRDLAARSGRAFSKSTVTKLIHDNRRTSPPPLALSQKYVAGIVRGCGGDEQEIARWVTAFRLLDTGQVPALCREGRHPAPAPYPETTHNVARMDFRRPASSE